jgi:hypothetical protein
VTPVRRWSRRAIGVLTVVVALGGVGVAPLVAVADDEDPRPTEWPTVQAPTEGGASQSDPQPTELPTVKKPDSVGDEDPAPTDWPAPVAN